MMTENPVYNDKMNGFIHKIIFVIQNCTYMENI